MAFGFILIPCFVMLVLIDLGMCCFGVESQEREARARPNSNPFNAQTAGRQEEVTVVIPTDSDVEMRAPRKSANPFLDSPTTARETSVTRKPVWPPLPEN